MPFTLVYAGKYRTQDKLKTDITKTKHNREYANNTKHSKTKLPKLPWFSLLWWHSASKWGGLILQCSQAHTGYRYCRLDWVYEPKHLL